MEFAKGDRVKGTDEHGNEVVGTFIEICDPGETVTLPLEGGTRQADAAWIRPDGDDGVVKLARSRLWPA
jgi:hypothetical protein